MKTLTPLSKQAQSSQERQAISRLRQLFNDQGGLLRGHLIRMRRACGKDYCRCAGSKRHRHASWYVGQSKNGRPQMKYLPEIFLEEVRGWIKRYLETESLLEQISELYWERLKRRKP